VIAVISIFRNCHPHGLDRYFSQVAALAKLCPIRLIAVEGDSVNDTRGQLLKRLMFSGISYDLVIREHGGPWVGSVESKERMRQVSFAANGGFEAVRATDDAVFYVESDLIWDAAMVPRLAAQLAPSVPPHGIVGVDVIAPSIFAGDLFYDIWGFRALDGTRFCWSHPYMRGLTFDRLFEIGSAGSALVMRGAVGQHCRLSVDEALVGFCKHARSFGCHIYTDFRERVNHT
jgi:hypothetical protein